MKTFELIRDDCGGKLKVYRGKLESFEWLNKNMFDYRELIPKGHAIEVTKDNNPYKD